MKSSIALAALVAATIGLSALPSFAQNAASPTVVAARMADHGWGNGPMMNMGMGGGGGPTLAIACADKGAEALEIMLVRLSHRVDLSADQQNLFEDFRAKALIAQTSFADSCKTAMPDDKAAQPDLLAHLKSGLAIETARLAALNELLPTFEAFYNSLTDAQKAGLMPQGDGRHFMFRQFGDRGGMDRGGMDRGGMDRMVRPPAPGR